MTYRVEAIESVFKEMGNRLGQQLDPQILKEVSKKTHASTDPSFVVTWEDLHAVLEPAFYKKLVLLAKRYGYDVKAGLDLIK